MGHGLSGIDIGVVVLYVLGTTLLGAWFARGQRDVRTYFVGDRNVSWPLILASIVATETSTVTFLSVPGLAFKPDTGNLTFLQLAFGYVVGRVVIAWLLLPQYLRGELFSAYQLLRERFSPAVQRTASGLFLATRTVADGLRLFLTALLLRQFTGWDMTSSILAMGAVTLLYTYLGGMQAVIWTDLIQLVIYLLGAAWAAVVLLNLLPGGLDEYLAVGGAAGKFTLFDFSTDPAKTYTFWAGLIGGAFFTMASHGADQLMVQRYLCSRSLRQAQAALVLSGVVVLLQFLLFLLIGVGLYVLYQAGLLPLPEGFRNDEVFGAFIVQKLPVGVVGLVIAAVLAAAMSTLSSSLNSSATAFVADFYRPLRPNQSEGDYLRVSRGMTLFWGVAQMGVALVALYINSRQSVVDQVLRVAGLTTGIVLGLFLLGSMPRRVSSTAALAGMVIGLLVVLAAWLPSALGPAQSETFLRALVREDLAVFLASTWGRTPLAWPWYAPVGAFTTVAAALLLSALGITGPRGSGSAVRDGNDPLPQ